MKFSKLFYIAAFVIALLLIGYEYLLTGRYLTPFLVIPAIIGGLGYLFSAQLDFWWLQQNPPKLDQKIKTIYELNSEFYRNLDPQKKRLFDSRVELYIEAKEWIYVGSPGGMPYDLKGLIAFQAVRMTINMKDFLLEPYDRIVLYPNPFLSPSHPERYHASEINHDDGVIILSLKHVLPAFRDPLRYFDVALYEFGRAFKHSVKHTTLPAIDENFFYNLYDVANYGHREIMGVVGLPDIDPFGVAVHHYFTYGPFFERVYPEIHKAFNTIFGTFHLPLLETVFEEE